MQIKTAQHTVRQKAQLLLLSRYALFFGRRGRDLTEGTRLSDWRRYRAGGRSWGWTRSFITAKSWLAVATLSNLIDYEIKTDLWLTVWYFLRQKWCDWTSKDCLRNELARKPTAASNELVSSGRDGPEKHLDAPVYLVSSPANRHFEMFQPTGRWDFQTTSRGRKPTWLKLYPAWTVLVLFF